MFGICKINFLLNPYNILYKIIDISSHACSLLLNKKEIKTMLKINVMPMNYIDNRPMHNVVDRFFDVDNFNCFYNRKQTKSIQNIS